ncbi:MAG: type II toxin-antitoxin system HicB family antitoxin [Gammaproteobacteria bacterium]
MRYVVYVESHPAGFRAYVPDIPGCVAVADTREEALRQIRENVSAHHEGLRASGKFRRPPSSELVAVNLA